MSNTIPLEGTSNNSGQSVEERRVVVGLPYAISNMVFFQALPLWLIAIIGVINGFVGCFALISETALEDVLPLWISAAVCVILGVGGLLALKYTLWRWAFQGYSVAIVVLYLIHLSAIVLGPLLILPVAAFIFLPYILQSLESPAVIWMLIVVLIIFGILWFLALINLFEKEIWSFVRLDGRCPLCRKWRFGCVRKPRIIHCVYCGAVLDFRRFS